MTSHVLLAARVAAAPLLLIAAWAAIEMARLARCAGNGPVSLLAVWALRPWACWAALNLFNRLHSRLGFNEPSTFPFYAEPWWRNGDGLALFAMAAASGHFWFWLAVFLGAAAIFAAVAGMIARGADEPDRVRGTALAAAIAVLAFWLGIGLAHLPEPDRAGRPGSFLAPWHKPSSTLIYAMPMARDELAFMRDFARIQPRLRMTIHGFSHPPGAVLSLRLIGRIFGAGSDIRSDPVKRRYAFGLAAAGALNALAIYWLAASICRSRRAALVASALWAAAPATLSYMTFAQDLVYGLFFNLGLALGWRAAVSERTPWAHALALGATLACAAMMNYSWIVLCAVVGCFGFMTGIARKWSAVEWGVRLGLPFVVAGLLIGAVLLIFKLDYIGAFRVSSAYVREWYRFDGPYQWWLALIGGQLDLWIMMGSVALVAFLSAAFHGAGASPAPAARYLWTILGALAIPVLAGPNALKMEASRCWGWALSVPFAFAAARLLATDRPVMFVQGALAASLGAALIMRLVMDFGV